MAETRIHVDFNDFAEDGRLPVLADLADGPVFPKWPVVLWDEDGNHVCAVIEDLQQDGVAFARLDWSSWNRVRKVIYAGLPRKIRIGPHTKQTGMTFEDAEKASTFVLS